jgi:superfamily II DNA or RNA helicase
MTIVPGALVQARGEAWMVTRAEPFDRGLLVTLEGRGRANAGSRLRLLTPFDRIERPPRRGRPRRRRRDLVARVALAALAVHREARSLWTAAHADMTVLAWQLEPALAVIHGATRVLLADEVGLGKTLQAGLIASELLARGLADRVLVLAPAGLRRAWATELAVRFQLRFTVFDHDAVLGAAAAAPPGVNPWTTAPLIVSSIDLVKRADVRSSVESAPFDLLIVDEAHHLTPDSDRGSVVARLAARVPWLVLVSATPHTGDDRAFAFLTDLGVADRSDTLTVFRRGRDAVGLAANRSTRALAVTPTAAELALMDGVHEYARHLWRESDRRGRALALVASTLARRAASSALAIERSLERRFALVGGSLSAPEERQAALPWEELDESDEDSPPEWLGMPGMDDLAAEHRCLERLIGLARSARAASSKAACLRRLVRRVAEPVVVFTEFRDTLEALVGELGASMAAEVIHGGLDPRARAEAIARFTTGGARLLLATDAAGEGLNLHQRCRLVVTVEWPWSPLRLEQRIGRVDRIGQAKRVHAVHLFHRGTVEDTVLARLLTRRDRARQAMQSITEEQVARAVFEEDPHATVADPPLERRSAGHRPPPARAAGAGSHAALAVEAERRALAQRSIRADAAPCWTTARHRSSHVIAVCEVTRITRGGCLADRRVVPLRISLSSAPVSRLGWQRVITRIAADARVLEPAAAHAAAQVVRDAARVRTDRMVRRIGAMRARLRDSRPRLVQSSLFDQRALRAAAADRDAVRRIDEHLARRAAQLEEIAEALRLPGRSGQASLPDDEGQARPTRPTGPTRPTCPTFVAGWAHAGPLERAR